ncbi:hypothetical protein K7432_011780 [Basidiobolus ranarum]|uniref:Uncharacterized protein n=1 Tax=Basidiobolus ranarum TaxID=34480 RepID=A0ABR2WLT5_9FUNG
MSPVNKRPKVLRYDSNSHSGYVDPYNQRLEHQTKPIAANGIPTPVPMGQESLGLIFGTLSPPESETEGYIDQVHQANGEHLQPRYNGDANRFPFVNTIKQTS